MSAVRSVELSSTTITSDVSANCCRATFNASSVAPSTVSSFQAGITNEMRRGCGMACLAASRRASPNAAEEEGGAQTEYPNSLEPPSGKRGRRLGAGASLGRPSPGATLKSKDDENTRQK